MRRRVKRILVFGAGAVGCLVGGLLAKAGHQVAFIGRRRIVEALRDHGLSISGVWGDHCVPGPLRAAESIEDLQEDEKNWDWVLVTTKSFDTAAAADSLRPLASRISFCISLQNGLGNIECLADALGWDKTLGGRGITGDEIPSPGRIQVTVHADDIRRHEVDLLRIEKIAGVWREAGIPVEATEELEQFIWAKVLYNAALNPLGALLGVTYGQLADHESTRGVMDDIINEAYAVASSHGICLFWRDAASFSKVFYETMVPPTRAHHPSMLRDLERGRKTEIDALNGAIVRLGEENVVAVPTNRLIVRLLRYREDTGRQKQGCRSDNRCEG